jgi:hypothetical protein
MMTTSKYPSSFPLVGCGINGGSRRGPVSLAPAIDAQSRFMAFVVLARVAMIAGAVAPGFPVFAEIGHGNGRCG